ncbi:uncharacterized protein LOC128397226 [Panonychus citri]|uniref:uncharacterized protein LOC128397226 n=1 Tax=Panonychus citri TaxID=50023 RepID=UPI002307A628|nr:uncharacterized protein LOC128397226 [Panonychus citri]
MTSRKKIIPKCPSSEETDKVRYSEAIDRMRKAFGNENDKKPERDQIMKNLKETNAILLEEDMSLIKQAMANPRDEKGNLITDKQLGFLRANIKIMEKHIRGVKANAEPAVAVEEDSEDPTDSSEDELLDTIQPKKKKIKRSMNIETKQITPKNIPANWWPWKMTQRYFRLIINGDEKERTVNAITEIISKLQRTYSFKVICWKKYTLIITYSEKDRDELQEKIKSKTLTTEIPEWRRPAIKILFMKPPVEESWNNYIDRIMRLNGFKDNKQYKLKSYFAMTEGKYGVVIEVSPAIRSAIEQISKGRISVGYTFLSARDNFDVINCRLCHRFGHTRNKCNNQSRCTKCAGRHTIKNCTSQEIKCASCEKTDHSAYSRNCPLYRSELQMAISLIDYQYDYLMM